MGQLMISKTVAFKNSCNMWQLKNGQFPATKKRPAEVQRQFYQKFLE
jgi:hypothetical protein